MISPGIIRVAVLITMMWAASSTIVPSASVAQGEGATFDMVDPPVDPQISPIVKKVLVVFVRFKSDSLRREGCTEAARAWRDPDSLPPFAEFIFAHNSIPPFDTRSLTDYFFRQSRGQLLLFGESHPDVVVTAFDDRHYASSTGQILLGALAKEMLIGVDEDPRTDLSEFDVNDDGYLDYVIGVLRSGCGLSFSSGASGIAILGYQSPAPEFGNDPDNLKEAKFHMGAWVLYDNAGNIFPHLDLFRLIAHEMGHPFVSGVHLSPIAHPFGTPANDPGSLAYFLMLGRGDCAGSLTMSAMERDLRHLGWIECQKLTRDTTVVVRDVYSADSSNCFRAGVLGPDGKHANLYLSNRQRIGNFDRLRTESCYGVRSDHGLMTTGLLATMVDRKFQVSVLAADNSIELGLLASGYEGDMFRPPNATQLTPWTTPNIHGLSRYPSGYALRPADFVAIDSVRYSHDDPTVMEFDYRTDFRQSPTIRRDSRIGIESGSLVLQGLVRVTNQSELSFAASSSIHGAVVVEGGSSVHVLGEVDVVMDTLHLKQGASLQIDGGLTITTLFKNEGGRIDVGEGGHLINLGIETIPNLEGCSSEACAFTLEAFPNPFDGAVSLEVTIGVPTRLDIEVFDAIGRSVA
ncbi:MAG: hypothetical protein KJO98_07405, partial [Rhodothermia bacterium]|nr:hypothetical protein [Rhodothermia bacterium]